MNLGSLCIRKRLFGSITFTPYKLCQYLSSYFKHRKEQGKIYIDVMLWKGDFEGRILHQKHSSLGSFSLDYWRQCILVNIANCLSGNSICAILHQTDRPQIYHWSIINFDLVSTIHSSLYSTECWLLLHFTMVHSCLSLKSNAYCIQKQSKIRGK